MLILLTSKWCSGFDNILVKSYLFKPQLTVKTDMKSDRVHNMIWKVKWATHTSHVSPALFYMHYHA